MGDINAHNVKWKATTQTRKANLYGTQLHATIWHCTTMAVRPTLQQECRQEMRSLTSVLEISHTLRQRVIQYGISDHALMHLHIQQQQQQQQPTNTYNPKQPRNLSEEECIGTRLQFPNACNSTGTWSRHELQLTRWPQSFRPLWWRASRKLQTEHNEAEHQHNRWYNKAIGTLIRLKHHYYFIHRANPTEENRRRMKRQNNMGQGSNTCSKTWKLGFICKRKSTTHAPHEKCGSSSKERKILNPCREFLLWNEAKGNIKTKLNQINQYFQQWAIHISKHTTITNQQLRYLQAKFAQGIVIPIPRDTTREEARIAPYEVTATMLQLKPEEACGFDNITNDMLRHIPHNMVPIITDLLEYSWESGAIPKCWKHAIIQPIPKKAAATNPADFRPISLLPCFANSWNELLTVKLTKHVQLHSILTPNQYGFRSKTSTSNALLAFVNSVHKHIYTTNVNAGSTAVLIDLKAAYDSVCRFTLIRKLQKERIPAQIVKWTASLLSTRTANTRTVLADGSSQHSSTLNFDRGVPQGSSISPILFNIYINDISKQSTRWTQTTQTNQQSSTSSTPMTSSYGSTTPTQHWHNNDCSLPSTQ